MLAQHLMPFCWFAKKLTLSCCCLCCPRHHPLNPCHRTACHLQHMAAERFAAEEALLAEADAVETRGEGLLDDTRDTAGKLQDKAAGVFEQAKQALKGDKTRKAKVQKVEVEL